MKMSKIWPQFCMTKGFLFFVLIDSFGLILATEKNQDCIDLWLQQKPELAKRFTSKQIGWLCTRTDEWIQKALEKSETPADEVTTPKQRAWLNDLRACQGSACLTKVVKCVGKKCNPKKVDVPEETGPGWSPKVLGAGGKLKPQIKPGPFADFMVQSEELETFNFDAVDPNVLLDETDDPEACEKRLWVSNVCYKAANSSSAEEAFPEQIAKGRGSKEQQKLKQKLENKFKQLKRKCIEIMNRLKRKKKTFDDIKTCGDPTKPKAMNKKSIGERCNKVLKAKNAAQAFPEEFKKARSQYAKSQLVTSYGRWLEKCRDVRDQLAETGLSFDNWIKNTTTPTIRKASKKAKPLPTPSPTVAPVGQGRGKKGKGGGKRVMRDDAAKRPSEGTDRLHESGDRGHNNNRRRNNDNSRREPEARMKRAIKQPPQASSPLGEDFEHQFAEFFADNTQDPRAYRKEYRMLTDDERRKYQAAITRLKHDKIDGISKYDLFAIYHTPQESPGAHWGPAFLPFHREYLKQVELALRQIDPSVAMPYWDSTLDEGLPSPKDSILWTPEFFGNGDKVVVDGPFANWTTTVELSNVPGMKQLFREVGDSPMGAMLKQDDIDYVMGLETYPQLTACIDPTFEMVHGVVHLFVGGFVGDIGIAPNDPCFYMHHCFIDYIWEEFRQTKQTPEAREADYPPNEQSCNDLHYSNAITKPFLIQNRDGLSNNYTKELFHYHPRPTCSEGTPTCSSPYLYCDTTRYRCLSKIRPNGNCTGYDGKDICYASVCIKGVCQASDAPAVSPPTVESTITPLTTTIGGTITEITTIPPTMASTTPMPTTVTATTVATTTTTETPSTTPTTPTTTSTTMPPSTTTTTLAPTTTTTLAPTTTTTLAPTTTTTLAPTTTIIATTTTSESTTTTVVTTTVPTTPIPSTTTPIPTTTPPPVPITTTASVPTPTPTTPITTAVPKTTSKISSSTALRINQNQPPEATVSMHPKSSAATTTTTAAETTTSTTTTTAVPTTTPITSTSSTARVTQKQPPEATANPPPPKSSTATTTAATTTTTTTKPVTTTQAITKAVTATLLTSSVAPVPVTSYGGDNTVYFTCTVAKGAGYYLTTVPNASIKTTGANVPAGYTQTMPGKLIYNLTYPNYMGAAVVQVPDPKTAGYNGMVEFTIEATDGAGKKCQSKCYSAQLKKYTNCPTQFKLSTNSTNSDPIQMKPNEKAALESLWTQQGHYKSRLPDYCYFQC